MQTIGLLLFGLLLGWLMIELLLRLTYSVLPFPIQSSLRYVARHPFTAETILPAPAWYPEATYQMVTAPNLDQSLQFPNPNVSFHLTTKNWLTPDSHIGFRVDSPDWEPRWPVNAVVVGDSFSFCFTEYPDCWVRRLETDYGLSVVNLGQGATGSLSHLGILLTYGLPYEPEVVIWQWYGNDANEDYGLRYGGSDVSDASAANRSDTERSVLIDPESAIGRWLRANSGFYWVLRLFTNRDGDRSRHNVQLDPYYLRDEPLSLFYGREYSIESSDMTLEKNRVGEGLGLEALLEARAVLDEKGIPLVVVTVPFKEEVYADWMEEELGAETLDGMRIGRQNLIKFCIEEGFTCYDPTADLIAAARAGEQLYFERDTHLNAAGNRLLADLIYEAVFLE